MGCDCLYQEELTDARARQRSELSRKSGCDRVIDIDGDDVLIQLRPAASADHQAISPNFVPEGEILGRMSRAVFIEAARALELS